MDIKNYTQRTQENLVQKVLQYNDDLKLSFPGYVSEKLDGVFALAIVDNNETYFFSRTGKEYTSISHISLQGIANYTCCQVFIGELYNEELSENTISGYARDTKQQHKELKFYIHDLFTLEEFKQGKSKLTYLERNETLKRASVYFNSDYVVLHYSVFIQTLEDLQRWARWLIYNDKEGVVYRYSGGFWQAGKRNTDMIKIKKELTVDLLCVDIVEGVGKCAGMLGKIVCKSANNKIINVGTGFDNEQRLYYFNNPSTIINKIVTVSAMEKSKNGILRQPIFKGVRHDKIYPEDI